ncbi:MAG: hypothetical protein JXB47_18265 [Anaerolineae bacterium]|nr:hypothetical protein [Anaerolineae bacterium]
MTENKPVRGFLLSDVPFVRRVAPQGVSLDTVTGLTRGLNPINEAFLSALPLSDFGMPTYILRDGDEGLVGLLRHKEGAQQAYIAYLAPDLDKGADEACWLGLVEGLVQAAGRRGAHILNAEVDPGSQTFVALREAGFVTFSRQDIWRRTAAYVGTPPARLLRPAVDADVVGVTALYVNTVPHLAQQAIPPPEAGERGLVHYNDDGHAMGYLTIFKGQRGVLIRPLLHPEAYEQTADLIADALTRFAPAERTPVYCVVQSYQQWLREPLASAGFTLWARQAVMGKHTVRRAKDPALQPLPANPRAVLDVLDVKPPPLPESNMQALQSKAKET